MRVDFVGAHARCTERRDQLCAETLNRSMPHRARSPCSARRANGREVDRMHSHGAPPRLSILMHGHCERSEAIRLFVSTRLPSARSAPRNDAQSGLFLRRLDDRIVAGRRRSRAGSSVCCMCGGSGAVMSTGRRADAGSRSGAPAGAAGSACRPATPSSPSEKYFGSPTIGCADMGRVGAQLVGAPGHRLERHPGQLLRRRFDHGVVGHAHGSRPRRRAWRCACWIRPRVSSLAR